jgi:uncharacterized membrane protein YkvA (DUF1232 family)
MLGKWKDAARELKKETYTLYLACRHPQTPWYAKLIAACVVGYAFSPIDLIPDFIPVLGLLDDLILIPLGITLVIRLIPPGVFEECRQKASAEMASGKPTNSLAAAIIVIVWISLAVLEGYFVIKFFR